MNAWLVLAAFCVFAAAMMAFVWWKLHARGLGAAQRSRITRAWEAAVAHTDPVRQILEADKALDLALDLCGFHGSLGDKLKAAGPRFSDKDAVWRAHKLRNQLAHETHASANPAQADAALRAFRRGIEDAIGGSL